MATSLLMKKIRLYYSTFDILELSVRTKTTAKFVLISRMLRSGPWPDWQAVSWLEISAGPCFDRSASSLSDGFKAFPALGKKKKKSPLSGDVKGGPGVRKAPSSCSHNARLITLTRPTRKKLINKKMMMGCSRLTQGCGWAALSRQPPPTAIKCWSVSTATQYGGEGKQLLQT